MTIFTRLLILSSLALVSACASTGGSYTQSKQADPEAASRISFAPAIDVPYSEVVSDIRANVGVNVRWGGQVIDREVVDESTTRLTVYAYPLDSDGRPVNSNQVQRKSGRFVVELSDGFASESDFSGHLLTFYGDVTGEQLVTNGNRQKTLPVINVEELVDWSEVDKSRRNVSNRRGNAFYGLGYNTGHFGFGSSFYGGSRFGYGSPYYSSFYFSRGRGRSFRGFRGRHH